MTSLERVARFLGDAYTWSGGGIWVLAENDEKPPMSDADLLLALLERAAELGHQPCLQHNVSEWLAGLWTAEVDKVVYGYGPTPLAAMIQAVEKYETNQGDKT